jgi:hypothetical protein
MPSGSSFLQALEQKLARWSRSIEIGAAAALTLATALSAWCAYQSNLWNGEMVNLYNASTQTRTKATLKSTVAQQVKAMDVGIFVQYAAAYSEGNRALVDFLYRRARPELRRAVDAWKATDPRHNPHSPSTPFEMPVYSIAQAKEADELNVLADRQQQGAQQANGISDRYVLLTVFFAIVMFFAGIAGQFASQVVRNIFNAFALVLLVVASISMIALPPGS